MANHHNTPGLQALTQLVKQSSSSRRKVKQEAPELPELPELPEVAELAPTPELPEVPELPEAPKVPELPKVSSDLVSQARNARMTKESVDGVWPFRGGTSAEDIYYDQQLARYVVLPTILGGGAALTAAVIRHMKSAPPKAMITPQRSTAGPMTLSINARGKEEEDDEDNGLGKIGGFSLWPQGPPPGATESSPVTDRWAPVWMWPAAAALAYGAYEGGDVLGRYINKKRRKSRRQRTIDTAREDYDAAMVEQRNAANAVDDDDDDKIAAYDSELDSLFDNVRVLNGNMVDELTLEDGLRLEKVAGGFGGWVNPLDVPKIDFPQLGKDISEKWAPPISRYAGALGLLAVLTGIPSGVLVYNKLRQNPKQQDLTEAIRRRRAETYRRRPAPVQLELNTLDAREDEDDEIAVAT